MERGWTQVSLDGVRVGGDKGVEAGEGGGQGEGNSGGGERGAQLQRYWDAEGPGLGLAMCAGQGRVGRAEGEGGPRVSGQHGLGW